VPLAHCFAGCATEGEHGSAHCSKQIAVVTADLALYDLQTGKVHEALVLCVEGVWLHVLDLYKRNSTGSVLASALLR
jgi:hypothetical protein